MNARKLLLTAAVMSFVALPALAQTSSTAEKNGHHYSGGPKTEVPHHMGKKSTGSKPASGGSPLWGWTQDRCTAPHGAKKGAVIVIRCGAGFAWVMKIGSGASIWSHPSVTETFWSSTRIALAPAIIAARRVPSA
jgi:hypothetical protein